MLVCAPTGAGKTNIAMLAILSTLREYWRENGEFSLSAFKIVYVAPMKALVSEVVGNFSGRLKTIGIKVWELTGDIKLSKHEIEDT